MQLVSRLVSTLLVIAVAAFELRGAGAASFDAKKEEQAIRALDTKWAEAVVKRDVSIALSLYAHDVTVLDPEVPAKHGLDAMRTSWTDLIKTPGVAIAITPEKIEFSATGDLATDFGRFELEFDGPNGHVKMVNKYLTIWRKFNGQWKVTYDCWNTNAPSPK